jgi:hypothetical protein
MFNSEVLEVAIGLVFVYLLLCLLCSGIKEAVARLMAWRSKTLEQALKKLFNNPELLKEFYQNSLLRELHLDKWYHKILGFLPVFKQQGKPTSISSQSFVTVLSEYLLKNARDLSREEIENLANELPDGDLKKALLTIFNSIETGVNKVEDFLARLKEGVSTWFDQKMEQLTAWYKRKAKACIFIIAVLVVSFLNIDTFMIANSLYHNSELRNSVVNAAAEMAKDETSPTAYTGKVRDMIDDFYGDFQVMGLPIGWAPGQPGEENKDPRAVPVDFRGWFFKVLGLLLTAIAVTLGAPFWYQKLQALLRMRSDAGSKK